MAAGGETQLGPGDVLDVLSATAGHIIEARALLTTLSPDQHGDLHAPTDGLLMAIGRRIAASLSPSDARSLLRPEP